MNTKHSYERGDERLNLSKSAMDNLAEIAFEKGLQHKDTSGVLKRYFDKLFLTHKRANNIRIYGEQVFIFVDKKLVTVFQLPNNLKAIFHKQKTRFREGA